MDTDNYAQPLEKVMREERRPRPLPLKARDHMELFEEWVRINPGRYARNRAYRARYRRSRHPSFD